MIKMTELRYVVREGMLVPFNFPREKAAAGNATMTPFVCKADEALLEKVRMFYAGTLTFLALRKLTIAERTHAASDPLDTLLPSPAEVRNEYAAVRQHATTCAKCLTLGGASEKYILLLSQGSFSIH